MAISNTFDTLTHDGRVIEFDFDDPGNVDGQNLSGSSEPVDNFEGLPVSGDSGSSMFINDNGVMKIAGVVTFNSGDTSYAGSGGGTRLAPIGAALQLGLNQDNWSAFLNIGNVGLASDYNADGMVDAADYTVWRDNLGVSITLPGDTTPGTVTSADYTIWKTNFGATAPASLASSPVPEPSALALLLATAVSFVTPAVRRLRG